MQGATIFWQKMRDSLRLLPTLRLVWKSSPGWAIARIILVLVQGILPLVSIYLTKTIIDELVDSVAAVSNAEEFNHILPLLIWAAVVTVSQTLCTALSELVDTAYAQQVTDYMQGIIHRKSIEADLEYYENPRYYDALQRAQQEAPYRPLQILNRLSQAGQNGISLVAMMGLLLSLHGGIVGLLVVAAIPAVWARLKYARVIYRWQRRRTQMERQSLYLGWVLTGDQFAKEVRLFNLGPLFSQRYLHIRSQIYRERLGILTRRTIIYFAAQATAGLVIFLIFAFLVAQTIQGILRLGDLVLYIQALQRGQQNLRVLLANLSGLYEDNLFLGNLYEFLDLKPRIIAPIHPVPVPCPMQTGVVFHKVSFQYGTTSRQALRDINLTLRPGEVIALVGENGSGKTTLVKLLCRLYDPTAGRITIDGIDLRQFDPIALRRRISVIFQDYAKYHLTAQENIWLGNIDLPQEDDQIIASARRSGADAVISQLPQGYATILGKLFDQGEELSVGQWQKVALARAFLRNSQIIVMDEPTSAMDPKAEYEVFEKFRQLIQGQAAILISHRLSTVKMADCIYVMTQGSVTESGTHGELMHLKGHYAHLFEIQASQYQKN